MFGALPFEGECLVLAGSPIDLEAERSNIVEAPARLSPKCSKSSCAWEVGASSVIGCSGFWGVTELDPAAIGEILQIADVPEHLCERFRAWHRSPLDLPGSYYLQVVERLFRGNHLAKGGFQALGRSIDLPKDGPMFLLAGRDDEVTKPWATAGGGAFAWHLAATHRDGGGWLRPSCPLPGGPHADERVGSDRCLARRSRSPSLKRGRGPFMREAHSLVQRGPSRSHENFLAESEDRAETCRPLIRPMLVALPLCGLAGGFAEAPRLGPYRRVDSTTTLPVLLTLLVEIVTSLRCGEVGLDIVAALSMTGALALGEPLAAAWSR